jgi:hypothetical protein
LRALLRPIATARPLIRSSTARQIPQESAGQAANVGGIVDTFRMHEVLDRLSELAAAVCADLDLACTDADLLETIRTLEIACRGIDLARTTAAAELARRSAPSLGYAGLAVRHGYRTPDRLLANVAGISRADAAQRLRVAETDLSAVRDALAQGTLGISQADAIVRSLGDAAGDTVAGQRAIAKLVADAPTVNADDLAARSRLARAELEPDTALQDERSLRARRYLRIGPEVDGVRRIHGLLDPESSAVVVAAMDAATSPRRGGPRFVDTDSAALAQRLASDERTNDQLRLDALIDLVRVGSAVGHAPTFGRTRPAVRVVVSERDFRTSTGRAWFEGSTTATSTQTAQRLACDVGIAPVILSAKGEVLDLGVAIRPFSPTQRIALAVRDGGCRWPGCDRPPSWCEAHHILEWSRGGPTDLANGVLLCRHHHLLLHKNGWRIERTLTGLHLIPPEHIDPLRRPIPLPSKSTVAAAVASGQAGAAKHAGAAEHAVAGAAKHAGAAERVGATEHTSAAELPAVTERVVAFANTG